MDIFSKRISISVDDAGSFLKIILSRNGRKMIAMTCMPDEDNSLLLCDIEPYQRKRDIGNGYSSMMMSELLKYATQNGINEIHGNLSPVDQDHKDRLHHFYEKFGFEIEIYEELRDGYYGKIRKKL